MVTIQDTGLKEGIERAIERAKKLSIPVLVSEVQRVDYIDPLAFFAAGRNQFLGERFYWKDPSNHTFIVGIGIGQRIQSDQASDRFFHVEQEWKETVNNAIIIGDQVEQGTGPMMFGGFSFDPLKEKTTLWSKYSDALFHIPQFLLTKSQGQYFLTTNVFCTQHAHSSIYDKVTKNRQSVLSSISNTFKKDLPLVITEVDVASEEWKDTVRTLVEDLRNGELKKGVLARELRLLFNQNVLVEGVLERLLSEQHESFIFAFESNSDCFVGASPERLVKKQEENLFSTCLAGSIGRGRTREEDEQLGELLLSDEKNLIEHQFVVDMIKGAMKQVCTEVHIPNQPILMKMRDIQHLYTPVVGKATNGSSLLQLVEILHPTPALGGFPKKEAVEKIREIEGLDRGFYAGPIGWLDYSGNGEFAVAIRSALIQGSEASLFAGCGIVKDSDAESEYLETKIKFRPMLSALGGMKK